MDTVNQYLRRVPAWLIYVLGPIPAVLFFYWALSDQLGADPVKALEHEYGELSLKLIVLGLFITPLRRLIGLNLIKFRRAIGLLAFFYVSCHLLTYLWLDLQWSWSEIIKDVFKRWYVIVGFIGFLAMVPLAITSNNQSVRKLGGAAWKKLHMLTYIAAIAGVIHYILLVKAWPPEPLVYAAIVALLLGIRLYWARQRRVSRA